MKKELILTERNASYNELSRFFTDVAAWFQTPVEWLLLSLIHISEPTRPY